MRNSWLRLLRRCLDGLHVVMAGAVNALSDASDYPIVGQYRFYLKLQAAVNPFVANTRKHDPKDKQTVSQQKRASKSKGRRLLRLPFEELSPLPRRRWCGQQDSNLHGSLQWLLRPPWLPLHHARVFCLNLSVHLKNVSIRQQHLIHRVCQFHHGCALALIK